MTTKKSTAKTKPGVEVRLAAVHALEPSATPETVAALRTALADVWLVVAAAADFAREHAIRAVADDLIGAYARIARSDPNLAARVAIVRALDAVSRWDDDVFAAALATRTAPPPGSHEDTGAALRSAAALAYAAFGRDDALDVLAALLADRAPSARRAAAYGLGNAHRDAAALLRFKLLLGDDEGDVVQQLAESLLAVQGDRAIAFLAPLLTVRIPSDATLADAREIGSRAEIVALALGAARATAALPALIAWSNACAPDQRTRVGFLPIALLRDDAANAWLAERIAGRPADALAAARALATFASDPAIAALLRTAAADQRDATCRAAILALV